MIRVHCECCGDDMDPTAPIAVLSVPSGQHPFLTAFSGLIGRETPRTQAHFCQSCGAALMAFAVSMGWSLREGMRA